MTEQLQIRVYDEGASPTLIYLPGLHGDWTLVGGFRSAVAGRLRFVEFTYPRTLEWSLNDYAAAVEEALEKRGIPGGWLLGESFGSQVVWPIVARGRFRTSGIVLAGGFVRHPMRWAARLAQHLLNGLPLRLLVRLMFGYDRIARIRYRRSRQTLAGVSEFIGRRTELDRQAAVHRLRLVARNDPRPVAQQLNIPLYALSGVLDPVVPWFLVGPWLHRHCPALRDYKINWRADHNVLGSAPDDSARQVMEWMQIPADIIYP